MESDFASSAPVRLEDEPDTDRPRPLPGANAHALAQQLRETQALLDMAAQMGRLGAWAYDVGDATLTWSGEVCAIHEVPPGFSPTPEQSIAFFAPEYREAMAATISGCLANGSPFDVEGEIITARGRRIWVRALGEAQWDKDGAVRRLQGALQDISQSRSAAERELRMAEQHAAQLERSVRDRTAQLEAANKELEAFSHSIAHDLRAPLSSIDGFSRMLKVAAGGSLPPRCGHYLKRIQAGVQQMAELTDGLLAIASTSRADLRVEGVDLADFARAAAQACSERERGTKVETIIAGALPVTGDPRLLAVLMANLVGNAWKFTSHTRDPRIEVAGCDTAGGERVYYVRDNGAGFDMTYAGKLFEPFHRMHSTAEYEGTGIGLAIAQRVVSRHRGRIWAESAPGEGATFYFTLPPA